MTGWRAPYVATWLLLAGGALGVWAGQQSRPSEGEAHVQAAAIPEAIGPWKGQRLAVDDKSIEILETDDVASLEYRRGDEPPLWFAQVAGFGKRAAFHPPELCYVGSHFEVLERGPLTVSINGRKRQVMRLVIGQDNQHYEAWYWFTANDRMTANYYQQQVWLMLDSLARRASSGTLVRISTKLDHPERSRERLQSFLESFAATASQPAKL